MAKKRVRDSAGQLNWDVGRGRELAALRDVILETIVIREGKGDRSHDVKVTPRDMIDLLRVIDDHGQRCWPSIETIAAESRMSRRTVIRAIKALQMIDLLAVQIRIEDKVQTSNLYSINWTALHAMPMRNAGKRGECHRGTGVVPVWHSGGATVAPKPPIESPIEPPPPTPNRSQNQGRLVAEFKKAGIGAAAKLARRVLDDGLSFAEAVQRLEEGQRVLKLNPGAFGKPAGALYRFIENGSWPKDGLALQPPAERVDHERHWPAILAMTDDERLRLLPGEPQREQLRAYGPHLPETKFNLLDAYVQRGLHERQLSTA